MQKNLMGSGYHFFDPLTMKYLPSEVLVAVVLMLATSDPASGSVMARQVLFLPSNRSGKNRFCNSSLPYLSSGETPYAMPVVSEAEGPESPDRAIYVHD